jgi:hypothetical protein
MKVNIKQVLAMLICVFFLSYNIMTVQATNNISEDYSKIAQTSNLALYFNQKEAAIKVEDLTSGYLWSTTIDSNAYDSSSLNDQWKDNLRSMFNISYTNVKKNDGSLVIASSAGLKPKITTKSINNGLSINYNFSNIKISLSLEITVDKDAMNIRIPAESIKEEGDMGIVSIEMLPFFGAAKDDEDGYIFYPDGSGALLEFNDPAHRGAKPKTWNVYGGDALDFMQNNKSNLTNPQAMLPVYGIKRGGNAFTAVITEGEENALIRMTPTGNVVDLNRISTEFVYRQYYVDPRVKKRVIKKYDVEKSSTNNSIKYIMLSGDKANYSGMANAYRNYLLGNEKAVKHIKAEDKIPLGVDLFMGINEKGLLFDKFISMTTFSEAEAILEKFKNSGVEAIQTNLKGWTRKGYLTPPAQFPPNSKLGGSTGLEKLAAFTKSNDIKLYLQTDLVDAYSKYGSFSKRNDVTYQGNGLIVTDLKKEMFLFSPTVVVDRFLNSFFPQAKKYSISGINFSNFGSLVYSDYNKKHPSTRQQTIGNWEKIMNKAEEEIGSSAVVGGNAYALKNVDRLFQIPDSATGFFITSKEVPFYQMVVHGIMPYSLNPGNLSADFAREKLKWVEYGYMPYFELTYKAPEKLKYTQYNQLFTSEYDQWIDTAVGVYKEFNKRIGDLWCQYIVKHEEIAEDLYLVTYENGTKIYVNYKDNAVYADGNRIEGLNFLVIEKGGKTR